MTDERYNGWTNRETWAVALHIGNDQGWNDSILETLRGVASGDLFAGGIYASWEESTQSAREWKAGEVVQASVEELFDVDEFTPGEYTDRLRDVILIMQDIGSLWRVNWDELGASFLEDLEERGDLSE